MRAALILIFQLAMAIALFVVAPSPFRILQDNPQGWLRLYQETAELFAIPFCLLFFSFSKKPLFLSLRLGWGLWTAIISTGLLWSASVQFPEITEFGQMLIAFNSVFGFSLALFTIIELNKILPSKSASLFPLKKSGSQNSEAQIDLVEGA